MPLNIPVDKFEDYLLSKNLKQITVEDYMYYFYRYPESSFTQEGVARFLAVKTNRNTIGRAMLTNVQQFLKINWKELDLGEIQRADIADVEVPKLTGRKQAKEVKPIPHDWIPKIEAVLETEKDKIMLLVSYYCGLRVQELMSIRITSFNWEIWKKDMERMGECKVKGKGDKEGTALVPAFLMVRIARYLKTQKYKTIDDRIFSHNNEERNDRHRPRRFQEKLRIAGVKSGYSIVDEEGNILEDTNVHPHKFRHSYASYLLEKGMDLRKIQILLRHTSITSTQIYTHINKDSLKKEIEERLFG